MGCYAVAAMLEEPPSVACRHHVESSAHRLYERLVGARPGPPQERLELGKRFFYGVEIVCVKGSKQTRSWSRSAVRVRSSALFFACKSRKNEKLSIFVPEALSAVRQQ